MTAIKKVWEKIKDIFSLHCPECNGRMKSAVKYLAIENEGYIRGYAEAWKRAKEIKEGNNEQV